MGQIEAKDADTAFLLEMVEGTERMLSAMAADTVEAVQGVIFGHGPDNRVGVFPMTFGPAPGEKELFLDVVRAMFLVQDIERYAVVFEAWVTKIDAETGRGDKTEAVVTICRSRSGSLLRTYEIGRNAEGRINALTRSGEDQEGSGYGAMGNLLAPEPTPQLKAAARAWLAAMKARGMSFQETDQCPGGDSPSAPPSTPPAAKGPRTIGPDDI